MLVMRSYFFIDRKYRGQQNRHSETSKQTSAQKCFIYRKTGCWSSRHTTNERARARAKFHDKFRKRADSRFDQYIAEFEGQEEDVGSISEAEIEAITKDTENFEITDSGMFMTEARPLDKNSATQLILQLFNRSASHAILGNIDDIEEITMIPSSAASFLLKSRYGPEKFYGVMIDTGASGKLTAGYNQYLAYCRLFGETPINTIDEGAANAAF
ncbi:hypothetical protein K3495_g11211 [Podosphaera aphanis]|nr:hypothetical protein K3495_g11211 [Podosphaera aphanis]